MMGRKRVFKAISIMAVLWCILALSLSSQITDRPADRSILASHYLGLAPVIVNEPAYTVGVGNVISWTRVDDPDLIAYRLQLSLAPSFNTVWQERVVSKDWDATTFEGLPLDTMWYRVQAAFSLSGVDDTLWSAWSQSTFSIQDIASPTTSCSITPPTEWSTQDSVVLDYALNDPAGIDSVLLYRRIGNSGPWTMFDGFKPAGAPTDVTESAEFSSSVDLQGDNQYQFFVGGRDDAKAANWSAGDVLSYGNALRPNSLSPFMCEIKVDTKLPLSDAEFDSLYTTLDIAIPWSANDPIPASGFNSGLDTVYLYWGVDIGVRDSTTPVEQLDFTQITLETPGGADTANGTYSFTAPNDISIYYFYTVAVDIAGNRQVDTVIHKVRVFTPVTATLTLFDPIDTDDSDYTGSCDVNVLLEFTVPAVDSFVLCEDADFGPGCTVVRQQTEGPVETTWTFADCNDGEKQLYAKVFIGGPSATAEASIILDTQAPVLESVWLYDLSTGDRTFTDSRQVAAAYAWAGPNDDELQWLILSEDANFATADTTEIIGDVITHLTLSEGFENKTVYGYLVDQAEHSSATLSASIMLFEHPHNYPNPFNPDNERTNLVFILSADATVTVLVYDLFGNLVYENSVAATAGLNDGVVTWDGHNMQNEPVASGGYICLLKVGDREISRHKIAVIR